MLTELTVAILVLRLVAEGIGVSKVIQEIARRALAGEIITPEEIDAAGNEVANAVDDWLKNASQAELEAAVKKGAAGLKPSKDLIANKENDDGTD